MTAKRGRPRLELAGRRFGSWTVTGFARMKKSGAMWAVVCDCGETGEVRATALQTGESNGCKRCAAILRGRKQVTNPPFCAPDLRALRWD